MPSTPPSSFVNIPLTPPPTNEKPDTQADRVITLFREIQAGKHSNQDPWTEIQLKPGDIDKLERLLKQNEELQGFVKDKIRYDYDAEKHQLVIRMPTAVHELFIARIEDSVLSQLKIIREGSDDAAAFAQKVNAARSTEIRFPATDDSSGNRSKHEPDASFWHDKAQYPGVIIEVAYSQKKTRLHRLAEKYLLDSDASVQVVVGFDIRYGVKESLEATLSVWRPQFHQTNDGVELRVVEEVADEAFRDEQGNHTNHPGLRLQLSDFACEELTKDVEGRREIIVSTPELCKYLSAAESKMCQGASLVRHSIPAGVQKRKRSETPPEVIGSGDEARYVQEVEREAKRAAVDDPDYKNTSSSSFSE
ncbi:hypothetical protein ACJQWK_04790 [Exserohilum turcicum]|uniref:Uncharacterized protein n=1 Tax=Exserohilum turcicum (strain 28A) TaxID=671987 RepID=R0JYX5_EXST2|nr:uncharacterized protein SETTUDRAFT_165102 [Exserohilum turcica Et28A]EOA82634.1 hypothetical protein SETTUDRAFT_165102 [Exserohilum turcica Et28A]